MTDYTKSTNFASKDSLPPGSALKVVRGTEIDTEFNSIATAVATKADEIAPSFTGPVTITGDVSTTGNVTVTGNETITGVLTLSGNSAAVFNVGSTAQRPSLASVGSVRYNNTVNKYEGFGVAASSISISSITFSTTTATVTTASAHGLTTGNTVVVYNAAPSAYNGTFSITVTSTTTFTYTMASNPGVNATSVGTYGLGSWGQLGGGATGSGADTVFILNGQTISNSYTIPTGFNAGTFGPVSIASGVTVTVPSGSVWSII